MKELLIATSNQGKLKEIKNLIGNLDIKLYSLNDFPNIVDIAEENGDSFVQNADIKAKFYGNISQINTLSDDSGLSIDVLDGNPGIKSSDWIDHFGSQENTFKQIFEKIKNKTKLQYEDRILISDNIKAHFTCVLSLYLFKQNQVINFIGECHGNIIYPAIGDKGFGYDPIFLPDGHNKTFSQMTLEEKQEISHRFVALDRLKQYLIDYGTAQI